MESPEKLPGSYLVVVSVLVVVIIIFGWLYWQREQSWQEVQQQNVNLLNAISQQQLIEADGASDAEQRLTQYQQSMNSVFSSAVAALEWSMNQSGTYPFGEIPLGDARLVLLEGLVQHLLGMGFSGRIVVQTHVADFCMVGGGSAGYDLASAGMVVGQCELIGFEAAIADEMAMQQSVAFANFVNTIRQETGGTIQVSIYSRGNAEPLIPYPIATPGITAGFWNEIAAQNNRVEISIDPFSP